MLELLILFSALFNQGDYLEGFVEQGRYIAPSRAFSVAIPTEAVGPHTLFEGENYVGFDNDKKAFLFTQVIYKCEFESWEHFLEVSKDIYIPTYLENEPFEFLEHDTIFLNEHEVAYFVRLKVQKDSIGFLLVPNRDTLIVHQFRTTTNTLQSRQQLLAKLLPYSHTFQLNAPLFSGLSMDRTFEGLDEDKEGGL